MGAASIGDGGMVSVVHPGTAGRGSADSVPTTGEKHEGARGKWAWLREQGGIRRDRKLSILAVPVST